MKYLSTFSGIGGFELGIQQSKLDAECIGFSEIDKYAKAIYQYHYPNHTDYGDITNIIESELPDFDLLVGGFPCQAFSIAGKRQGFEDTRGTLFFDVARLLSAKKPDWVVLENVKDLLNHDSGQTFATIYEILIELGYTVGWQVVNSCQFGVPQNRERIFIVGHLTESASRFEKILPIRETNKGTTQRPIKAPITRTFTAGGNSGGMHSSMTLIQEPVSFNRNIGIKDNLETAFSLSAGDFRGLNRNQDQTAVKVGTWRTHKDGQGFREIESGLSPTIPARAREDGSGQPVIKQIGRGFNKGGEHENCPPLTGSSFHQNNFLLEEAIRRLTPVECERLQGFPDGWTEFGIFKGKKKEISDTQRYKALGNAVTMYVIKAIANQLDEASL